MEEILHHLIGSWPNYYKVIYLQVVHYFYHHQYYKVFLYIRFDVHFNLNYIYPFYIHQKSWLANLPLPATYHHPEIKCLKRPY